jgi:uncharacterized protein
MLLASDWIEKLQLKPHPEGGFYSETYRSQEHVSQQSLPSRYGGYRSFGTAIYFLLRSEDISTLHRLKSDEMWFFHAGSALEVVFLGENGVSKHLVGTKPEHGQHWQLLVPANTWFGARVLEPNSFALVSCVVFPGFDFADFELAERQNLLGQFPQHQEIILSFAKP